MTYFGPHVLNNQKPKREDSPKHLKMLRQLPCCVCGNPPPNTVHHIKATGARGGALKSPDRYGVPMCMFPYGMDCHGLVEAVGSKNETKWFKERGVDAIQLAKRLWEGRE